MGTEQIGLRLGIGWGWGGLRSWRADGEVYQHNVSVCVDGVNLVFQQ